MITGERQLGASLAQVAIVRVAVKPIAVCRSGWLSTWLAAPFGTG